MNKIIRNVLTFAPAIQTRDAMPKPGDEEFLPKLDEHYRKEVRLLLSADPESHECARFFDDLKRLLETRADVIKTHETFMSAKKDVEYHTGNQATAQPKKEARATDTDRTSDWRARQKARHATQDRIASMNTQNAEFWAGRKGMPDTASAASSIRAGGKPSAASINASNAAFWNRGGNDAA